MAPQRLRRLARMYVVRLAAAGPEQWNRPRESSWTIREIVDHVSKGWYAEQVGDLASPDAPWRSAWVKWRPPCLPRFVPALRFTSNGLVVLQLSRRCPPGCRA